MDLEGVPERLPPLTLESCHILLALAGRERHGYAILREVAANTQGQLRIGPGALYRSIKRMIALRLIEESGERPDPALDEERRRHYRLTDLGRQVARAQAARLASDEAKAQRRLGSTGEVQAGILGGPR